ncbi:MAG: MerR family transcriptional regulator [Mycolicibacterium sp.]|uniref:MerR family transcriptional regulator n=1 Tax=Mycolicibacterium sp. TaxID=2320850 RepID=UPI00355DE4EB
MSSGADGHMQIGQVAARTELSIRTVRHYDDVGLVTPSARSAGGFRLYTDDDVARLLVIRRMKPLGFSLAEMKELLDSLETLDNPDSTAAARRRAAKLLGGLQDKVAESAARLRRQLAYADELADLLAARSAQPAATGR